MYKANPQERLIPTNPSNNQKTIVYTSTVTTFHHISLYQPSQHEPDQNKAIKLNLEPKPSHAALILIDGRLALLRGVFRLGEEHAVVAGGFFGLADAAGLYVLLVVLHPMKVMVVMW